MRRRPFDIEEEMEGGGVEIIYAGDVDLSDIGADATEYINGFAERLQHRRLAQASELRIDAYSHPL